MVEYFEDLELEEEVSSVRWPLATVIDEWKLAEAGVEFEAAISKVWSTRVIIRSDAANNMSFSQAAVIVSMFYSVLFRRVFWRVGSRTWDVRESGLGFRC